MVDDSGDANDESEETSFQFKGNGLEDLIQKLEEETGIENIIVCSRNKVNGRLYPLRLALPPNNATMHVVVVPSTSKGSQMPSFCSINIVVLFGLYISASMIFLLAEVLVHWIRH